MKKLFIVIFFIISLVACNQSQSIKEEDFGGSFIDIENPVAIQIEDFIADYDTIRLEVSDLALLDKVFDLRIMNDKLYILNGSYETVFIFSMNGKFINKINNRGHGPNEYIKIHSCEMDYLNNRILISDSFSRKIFIYDEFGNQIKVIPLAFEPAKIIACETGFINVYLGRKGVYSDADMESHTLHYLDSTGKFMFASLPTETLKRIDIGSRLAANALPDGETLLQPPLCDTIYSIGTKNTAKYVFKNHSKYKLLTRKEKQNVTYSTAPGVKNNPIKELEDKGYLLSWGAVCDAGDLLFAGFSGWNNKKYVYYSKNENKSILIIPDEVKGNQALAKILMDYPRASHGNRFFIAPNTFRSVELAESLPDGKLKTFLQNTDADANPIILSFSINANIFKTKK